MSKIRVGYEIDEEILTKFKERLTEDDLKGNQIISAALRSYSEGTIKLDRGRMVTTIIPTVEVKRPVGAPKKEKPIISEPPAHLGPTDWYHDDTGKLRDWFDIDHVNMPLDQYNMPTRIQHPSSDLRPHLKWDTYGVLIKKTFRELCNDFYMIEREKFSSRDWDGEQLKIFVSRVALKFFALNNIDGLRYDEDTLQQGMYDMRDDFQTLINGAPEGMFK